VLLYGDPGPIFLGPSGNLNLDNDFLLDSDRLLMLSGRTFIDAGPPATVAGAG
jgi:hypothetical protein